jgi:F-type H+-transporting ATPase subunit epsilon
MTSGLHINLVTPEKLYLSTDAEMVVSPGMLGDFGALPEHAPFVSLLRAGVIDITETNGAHRKVFVSSGFVEVNNKNLTILAEDLVDVQDLIEADLVTELQELNDDLNRAKTDKEKDRIATKITTTEAKIALAKSA